MKAVVRKLVSCGMVGLFAAGVFVALASSTAFAGKGGGGGGGNDCPRKGIVCPMVWAPVTCDDGKTYSNDCVAYVHCATGCVPADGGPYPL